MAECDWRLPDCHSATWGTLQRRWRQVLKRIEGYTLRLMAIQYCSVFSGAPKRPRDRWVRQLVAPKDGGRAPASWPRRRARWDVHAPLWADIYARAEMFDAGRLHDKCDGNPVHFGAGKELDRFDSSEWREVNCGDTGGQTFLERIK